VKGSPELAVVLSNLSVEHLRYGLIPVSELSFHLEQSRAVVGKGCCIGSPAQVLLLAISFALQFIAWLQT